MMIEIAVRHASDKSKRGNLATLDYTYNVYYVKLIK